MHIINLPTSTFRSPEYVGCEPVDRATWQVVHAYCVEQENGGVILNCRDWGERRWMSTCAITRTEALRECALFWWVNNDLHVAFYPLKSEAIVKQNRENGRTGGRSKSAGKTRAAQQNGKKGGRPPKPKPDTENPSATEEKTEAISDDNRSETEAETQHKEKREREKGKGKEEISPNSPQGGVIEQIYNSYPRKVGRQSAIKAITKAIRKKPAETILERTRAYAAAIAWKDRQFIPHPATWFNEDRFDDDPSEWKDPQATNNSTTRTNATSFKI